MNPIAIDYETFYSKKDYSVRHLGNWRYCHDDRFDPFLVSVFDGENSWVGNPRDFNWNALEGRLLLAHNAGFDSAVTHRLVEMGVAPDWLSAAQWQCTANMSSYLCSDRALDNAVLTLEGRRLDKGVRDAMEKKSWSDMDAKLQRDAVHYALGDVKECLNLWQKYSHRWPSHEQALSSLTMKQCARGVQIDVDLLEKYRVVLQDVIFTLERNLPWTERGKKPTSPIAVAEECRRHGIPAPPVKTHDEEGFIAWEATYKDRFEWVTGVSKYRSLNKLLTALDTIKERLRPDNTIDFSLLYFGAHTGRWSGGGSGFNMQNMRKVPLFVKDNKVAEPPEGLNKEEMKEWVAQTDHQIDVRALFVPRPGKKFILADLSQIEPRCLAWLTGNMELLGLIAKGMSIYEAFARVSMGWKGGVLKDERPDLYQLAKIQVLGLGYGCGAEKFVTIAAGYGVALTPERSQELVTGFREQNPQITALWRNLDLAFKRSVNSDFQVELPSGRNLTYRGVMRAVRSIKNKETGQYESRYVLTAKVGYKREMLYGGLLTENLVQATARDVFGEHLLKLEEWCGDVIFHVHDDATTEVDKDVSVRDVEQVMSKAPEWMPGLPVACEAKEADRYLK